MPLQTPELALTLTGTLPTVVGVRFAGVHVRPAVTATPLQVAAGAGVIVVPTVPVVAVIAQSKVGAELLLGAMLDELGGTEELLTNTAFDELLPTQDLTGVPPNMLQAS
jgi:hypothetical protein